MDLDTITRQFPYADLQLTFHEVGQRSSYPTIILIHGTGGNTDKHFSYIFPMLGIHQRVLSIDLHTPNKVDLKVIDFSQQVEALVQHAVAKDETITVVSYSLGAVIAAQVAASLKLRVARLILLAGWAKTSTVQQLRTTIWQQLFNDQSAALLHFVNYCLYSDDYLSARTEKQVLDLARFVKPSQDAVKQRELNYCIDITTILPDITAETLIVACREDRMVPLAQAKLLFASIENSRYIEISSGHALHIEAPAEMVQLINHFSQHPEQYPANQKIQPMMPQKRRKIMQAQGQRSKILIVGSGFGGLGMAIRLKQQGIHDFKIIERAAEVGGTWRDNTYPGVACDVPSHLYSFSFIKNPNWSRVFPQGAEIQHYLIQCCDQKNIRPHIDFHTQLENASWNAKERIWEIQTSNGLYQAEFLITATGHLADEHLLQIPGQEEFEGQVMHSARWNHEVNLDNQRVVVIGSGASAIQLVPEIAKTAKNLTVLQRSAPYILPRPDRPYSESEKQLFRKDPDSMSALRHSLFWGNEYNFAQRRNLKSQIERVKKNCLQFLKHQLPDSELQRKLTPNYEPGCKRLLLSNDYYPTFLKPQVTLEDSALAEVTKDSVISRVGNEFPADIIVFATGFEAARPPYAAKVVGKHGLSLEQQWSNGMQGYQSTTVHNFPNLFILNGPNTGSGHNSALYFLETQFDLVLDALQFFEQEQIQVFEADQNAENSYMQELQQLSQGSVWLSESCKSWYLDPVSRKLTLVWPDYAHSFRDKNQHFIRSGYRYQYVESRQQKVV